jgi:hypothetical protein
LSISIITGTRSAIVAFSWSNAVVEQWSLLNPKFQAPNFRVSGVPPEADQMSGKRNTKTETLIIGMWDLAFAYSNTPVLQSPRFKTKTTLIKTSFDNRAGPPLIQTIQDT